MPEQQNIEYKESWRDDYLKWICGFANAQGGQIFIGIDDKGTVKGIDDYKKLMEDLPNKVVQQLGLVVDIDLHESGNKHYIEIRVSPSAVPISYHGAYHYRSGSTKQELKGSALNNLLLKKSGKNWEDIPVLGVGEDDLDLETIRLFTNKAVEKDRIPSSALAESPMMLMKRLNLVTKAGELTNAAILLFGKRPTIISPTTSFKIGRFGKNPSDMLFHDIIETNLLTMAEKVMDKLKDRYLLKLVSYKGLERIDRLEYPETALREAVLNSIIHKDYSSTWTFLRIYDDRFHLWNPGLLPDELTIEELKSEHSSYPRNKNIADVFFKAGYVETWGRGFNNIMISFKENGLPDPIIEEAQGGLSVIFLKDIYTPDYLRNLDINDRQIKALLYIKEHGDISNSSYQQTNNIGKTVATDELRDLIKKELIQHSGTMGRGSKYILKRKL